MKHQSERHIIIAIMIQESSDIFLADGDALVYLAKTLLNKYSTAFVWGTPFSTYVCYDQFFNTSTPFA